MKKIFALAAVLAFAVVPAAADDIPDGSGCAASPGPVAVSHALLPDGDQRNDELDRGSVCVSDDNDHNGAELYIGGEIDTESSENFSCGSIEILGMQGTGTAPGLERLIFGDDDWNGSDCQ